MTNISPPFTPLLPHVSVVEHRADGDRASRAQREAPPAWRPEGQEQEQDSERIDTIVPRRTFTVNERTRMLTAPTEPTTEATPEETLQLARAAVHDLEAALASLPAAYAQATRHARAADLTALRHRRVDLESELVVARIRLVHGEIGVFRETQAAARLTEAAIAREAAAAESALIAARAAFDQAMATSSAIAGRGDALRWEQTHTRELILLAEDRLTALITAPMPD